jgi:hypothetical protein
MLLGYGFLSVILLDYYPTRPDAYNPRGSPDIPGIKIVNRLLELWGIIGMSAVSNI